MHTELKAQDVSSATDLIRSSITGISSGVAKQILRPTHFDIIDLSPKGWTKTNSYIGVTQENSIEIPLQSSLPYILLLMVCAYYCAPYPKWPCVEHEVNMWYPCYMTSFVLESSTSFYASHDSWPSLTLTLCSKNQKVRK